MNNKRDSIFIVTLGLIGIIFVGTSLLLRDTFSLEAISDDRIVDLNFYYCLKDIVGEGGVDDDGTLLDTALSNLTELKCNNKDIRTINGLELMPNLSTIELYGNKIDNIDLSANTKLKVLDLTGNKLSTINVDSNEELEELYLNNNKLSSLVINTCPSLKKLNVNNNLIEEVDVTNCTNLENYSITKNNIIIDDNNMVITNIPLNTTYDNFNDIVLLSGDYIITDNDGNTLDNNKVIKTGDIINIKNNNVNRFYRLLVYRDVDGNGVVNINDAKTIAKIIIDGINDDNDRNVLAGDMNNDGIIKMNDIVFLLKSF